MFRKTQIGGSDDDTVTYTVEDEDVATMNGLEKNQLYQLYPRPKPYTLSQDASNTLDKEPIEKCKIVRYYGGNSLHLLSSKIQQTGDSFTAKVSHMKFSTFKQRGTGWQVRSYSALTDQYPFKFKYEPKDHFRLRKINITDKEAQKLPRPIKDLSELSEPSGDSGVSSQQQSYDPQEWDSVVQQFVPVPK